MKIKIVYILLSYGLTTGCTTPRVVYTPVTEALTKKNADEVGALVRIPRSIIKIVNDESVLPDFISTAIDPIQTNKNWLPLNKGKYAYTLDVTHDESGTISATDFASISNNLIFDDLPSFPFPSCDYVTLKIYAPIKVNSKITVSAIPTELALPSTDKKTDTLSTLYRATSEDDFLSTTTLKISYFDNSLITKTVSTETQDNVKEEIKTFASIVGTLAAAAAAPLPPIEPTLEDTKEEIASFTLPVANNQNYLLVPLPTKGSITAHSTCGADVTDTSQIKSSVQNDLDVLQTAITEGINLYKKAKGQ